MREANPMPLAAFRISVSGKDNVDKENHVVKGCRLAEKDRLAVFNGSDGKPVELMVSGSLIDDLLGLATSAGRLDAYWTHDRLNADNSKDALHDSIGVWRNFAKDESGNLVADLHLGPTEYRDRVLWSAETDPQGIMSSLVFDYTGGRDDAKAQSLFSGDLVRFGAATTALLSAYQQPKTMTPEEIKSTVDEAVKAALAAHIEANKPADVTAEAAAIEAAAGVTDADKLPEDEKLAPAICAAVRIGRAQLRSFKAEIEAVKESSAVLAEAKVTAKLGALGTFVPVVTKQEPVKISKAQFAALDCAEQSAFFRKGGKVTE